MVIGNRLATDYFTENRRFGHNFGNKLVRRLVNWLFNANIGDIMTGQRAFSYDFVKSFPVLSQGFAVETEMTIHALDKNLKIIELPVEYHDCPTNSSSKLNTFSDGLRVLASIFDMTREFRPLFFFGMAGLLSFVVAVALSISPIYQFITTQSVAKFPSLIVAVAFAVIVLLLWSVALICNLINKKHRQLFEIQMNLLRQIKKTGEIHAKK